VGVHLLGDPSIGFIVTKHSPDDPCVIVRDGDGGFVEAAALANLVDPGPEGILLVNGRPNHRSTPMHENRPEGLISALADPHHQPTIGDPADPCAPLRWPEW
jgi:hypothetical protein